MNAGMYGQSSGEFGSRKVIRQTGRDVLSAGSTWQGSALGLNGYQNSVAIAANARTLIYSATGKGAARFFSAFSSANSIAIEVEVDGVIVVPNEGFASGGRAVVGTQWSDSAAGVGGMALDYLPFESSFRVYVTPNALAAINAVRWSYLMEAHQ